MCVLSRVFVKSLKTAYNQFYRMGQFRPQERVSEIQKVRGF